MRIQAQTGVNINKQPSFGMAKLTQKGEELAKRYISQDLQQFISQKPYQKRNMLAKLLRRNPNTDTIQNLFSYGMTEFGDKNVQFVNMQLTPLTGRLRIKSYLSKESKKALNGAFTQGNGTTIDTLTEEGKSLVNSILALFDANIANPQMSKKKGLRVLDMIKNYMDSDQHIKRAAILSDKIYSKK